MDDKYLYGIQTIQDYSYGNFWLYNYYNVYFNWIGRESSRQYLICG